MFREFFLPEYRYAFENVLRAGKMVFFHSCGCIHDIAGDLASIGVTELNPIQAETNDFARVKKDTVGKMALSGGIDVRLLATGAPEQVRREVIRVMEIMKPGGGYMCGPDQWLPDLPQENLDALFDTARDVGQY